MLKSHLSALKGSIGFIQLKLTDFVVGSPSVDKILAGRFIPPDEPLRVPKELILLADNHFELLRPICPVCGSDRATREEYRRRFPRLGSFGRQTVYLRRYKCTSCGKKFTAPLHAVVERCHLYAAVFKDAAANIAKTGYRSVRKLREDLCTCFGIGPSHQTIHDWLVRDDERRIETSASHYSGYYCYDEQHITLAGQKRYRLIRFDSTLNIPLAEEIAEYIGYKTV
jgi:transposase-like protein